MRRTLTISVSEEMHSLIYRGAHRRVCSSVSEYIRMLVRADQKNWKPLIKEVPEQPLRKANDLWDRPDDDLYEE